MLSLEAQRRIGSPTDTFVPEVLWSHFFNREDNPGDTNFDRYVLHVGRLAYEMVSGGWAETIQEATARITAALNASQVWRTYDDDEDGGFHVGLTDETRYRLERRYLYWTDLEPQGISVPAAIYNEGVIARAAVMQLHDDGRVIFWLHQVIEEVHRLMDYPNRFFALHVVLNAIDSGAITVMPINREARMRRADRNCLHSRVQLNPRWSATSS